MEHKQPLRGAGPFTFKNDGSIGPGEEVLYDFRNMEYNGQKGFLRKHLPLEYAQVTNLSTSANLTVRFNNRYDLFVVNSSQESFDQTGIVSATVINEDGTDSIAAGEVRLEVGKAAYDADAKAREEKKGNWVERAANDLIPGGVPKIGGITE